VVTVGAHFCVVVFSTLTIALTELSMMFVE
jgi:hypothetical protein